jgi:hypothetical protein
MPGLSGRMMGTILVSERGNMCPEARRLCNPVRRIMLPGHGCGCRGHGPAEPEVGWPIRYRRESVPRQASVALTDHAEAPDIDLHQVNYAETKILGDWCSGAGWP